ncbi:hypothetical protein K501DRAFT_265116 [Backusella circina FSU 941]|nr:hypothetical protein K501DRAFT_265116 [Backusella circina FSU 941]
MYKELKALATEYDSEIDHEHDDIAFCIYFVQQVLLLLKHQARLFNSDVDSSEWDPTNELSKMSSSKETAEEDSGEAKFILDRCKLSIKNKSIIDKHLLDGVSTTSVDSLRVSGLQLHFINTSLEQPGLYVTAEMYNRAISKSLTSSESYIDLALHLLCFRDSCIYKNIASQS